MAPTYDDLLKGLKFFTTSMVARGLTKSLAWYLANCYAFSPPLEINVLHTQSLVRAIREPLKPYGPQNLDKMALEEFRRTGKFFEGHPVNNEAVSAHLRERSEASQELKYSTLQFNANEETVGMRIELFIKHVLLFPFLTMLGMAGEGLDMGIEKAEPRKKSRTKIFAESSRPGEEEKPYHIPKRPRAEIVEGAKRKTKRRMAYIDNTPPREEDLAIRQRTPEHDSR